MSAGLILFVHGLGGNALATWGAFPDLIHSDPVLKEYDVDFFTFPTSLFSWPWSKNYPRIQTLAEALRTQIANRFPDRDDITLVCHSLGGLIGRKYLVEEVKSRSPLRVRRLLLYAVPNTGAQLASVGRAISFRHNQLRQLCWDADVIRDLGEDWFKLKVGEAVPTKYVGAALDRVVTEESARIFWGNPNVETIADRGHRDVVKPNSHTDTSFLILKNFLSPPSPRAHAAPDKLLDTYATGASRPATRRPPGRFRVIGFDLDGTLLRGFEFSWTLVWNHLGVPEALWRESFRKYLREGKTFNDYQEWCNHDYTHMRKRGLRRADFAQITAIAQPTKNLREALEYLRNEGFVLAIISGGIDVFVTETLPYAKDLFDYICINRFSFDDQGIISGIEATPFDFEGKALALETICKRHDATLAEAVFVGEAFNDVAAARVAGLSIAYPPHGGEIPAVSRVAIDEDNLLKILDHVLA